RGSEIQRERADVLGDYEVGVVECSAERFGVRSVVGVDRQAIDADVHWSLAGDRLDVEAEVDECGRPLGRLDGYAVASAEAEGNERCARAAQRGPYGPGRRRLGA